MSEEDATVEVEAETPAVESAAEVEEPSDTSEPTASEPGVDVEGGEEAVVATEPAEETAATETPAADAEPPAEEASAEEAPAAEEGAGPEPAVEAEEVRTHPLRPRWYPPPPCHPPPFLHPPIPSTPPGSSIWCISTPPPPVHNAKGGVVRLVLQPISSSKPTLFREKNRVALCQTMWGSIFEHAVHMASSSWRVHTFPHLWCASAALTQTASLSTPGSFCHHTPKE
jgi:hypothetical protein